MKKIEVHRGEDSVRPEAGRERPPVGDVCRPMGISEATFYVWKKKYGGLQSDGVA